MILEVMDFLEKSHQNGTIGSFRVIAFSSQGNLAEASIKTEEGYSKALDCLGSKAFQHLADSFWSGQPASQRSPL